jgi:type I restriction enzyme R subunit
MVTTENKIELDLIAKLQDLKYSYPREIREHETLEQNFRNKFGNLNKVKLTKNKLIRLLKTNVFKASKSLPFRKF